MTDAWGPPSDGWPSFDENGRRIHHEAEIHDTVNRPDSESAACHERNLSCEEHPRRVPDVAGRDVSR